MDPAYDNLLRDFARLQALDGDALVASEALHFAGFTVVFEHQHEGPVSDLLLVTRLGVPAPERVAEVHRVLLEANNQWFGTGGATLGLMPETGEVMCCARVALALLDGERLERVLEMFTVVAGAWRAYVRGTLTSAVEMPPLGAICG